MKPLYWYIILVALILAIGFVLGQSMVLVSIFGNPWFSANFLLIILVPFILGIAAGWILNMRLNNKKSKKEQKIDNPTN